MTIILQLNTSIFGDDGQSSGMADHFVARWHQRDPQAQVIRRDFAEHPIPHLTASRFQAGLTPEEERTPEQQAEARIADDLVQELLAADILVIGLPMYNFNVPSTLKAWFDHVARAGTTFRYTENGPEGLANVKKAYVFTARGGVYQDTNAEFQTPYIKQFLGFLGIEDIEFVYAEGMAGDEESRRKVLEAANASIEALAA